MAVGAGILVSQAIKCYWTDIDLNGNQNHRVLIRALGWRENTDARLRRFVRVEVKDWDMKNFSFDENGTLPGWAENNVQEIKDAVAKIIEKVAKVNEKFKADFDALDNMYLPKIGKAVGNYRAQLNQVYERKKREIEDKRAHEFQGMAGYVMTRHLKN